MLIDDLKERLKNLEPDILLLKNYWVSNHVDQEVAKLVEISQQPDFWKQTELAKKLQGLKTQQESYHSILENYQETPELLDLFADDNSELVKISHGIARLIKDVNKFKIQVLLNKPEDSSNCFVNINSGAGGTESQDWTNIVLRMYLRFCEQENFNAQILDLIPGEEAGIKGATLYIRGQNAFGIFKTEHGIHRLVRISPFDSNQRRHTSFCGVHVTPEVPDVEITIDPKELRIDTYRAGGAGGQHVNKTDSAVRITHLPTNIVVQCQNERSQTQNKEVAMKMLMAKLVEKQKSEQEAKLSGVEKKKIEWGSQIRSYVLHPYKMVKDHRTDLESAQPDAVLDGDLMPFIEACLVQQATQKL
ncbi:MAG TPA: peptide chain release factor 2 [Candidatus Babeliales bacterium]|nr:peptide chain release factor 2 [Candidatus Babeliales bacterium]